MDSGAASGAVELLLVRHGESVGNVAATAASAAGTEVIDVDQRDADVPLTATGQEQASALGQWLSRAPADERPTAVWCSPYLRTRQTAETALRSAGLDLPMRIDERLRDRELGVLDLLTAAGVDARFPQEAARRLWLGKFYYRPPGGESWADVALRLRSLMGDVDRLESGRRVLVVVHDAVILLFRYVCEGMDEAQLLQLAATSTVHNASVTRLVRPSGQGYWTADTFNVSGHLAEHSAPVTEHSGDTNAVPAG